MHPYPSEGWSHFAPIGRMSGSELGAQVEACLGSPLLETLLESLDAFALVLNEQRQVLAANPAFLTALGLEESELNHDLRPGEVLHCVHAAEGPDGCGSSRACRACGAALAILAAVDRDSGASEDECLLTHVQNGRWTCSEFKVKATPLGLGPHRFIVVSLRDISSEKRREALERIFLHDLANSIQGLRSWGELLEARATNPERALQGLVQLSSHLADEVAAQRLLLQAEQGLLEARVETFPIPQLLTDLDALLNHHACSRDRNREIAIPTQALALRSDRSLLLRVLLNMSLNALEATPPGGTVRLRFDASPAPAFSCRNPGAISSGVAERIFQRSFSTKGQGRGLGTYSMKLLGEGSLKGKLSFNSDEREGTCFRFQLPSSCLVRLGA